MEVLSKLIGTRNFACTVDPPGNKVPAMPLVAIAMAIPPWLLTCASAVLTRKVFPVPPEIKVNPSMKTVFAKFLLSVDMKERV